jgi:hypothetical protein
MPAEPEHAQPDGPDRFLSYIIRFDNKGYRVFDLDSLLNYFRQAHYVERIAFTLESVASIRTNRNIGSVMELQLDQRDPNRCLLMVTSDDKDWVDSSFSAVNDVISKCKNINGFARSPWTHLVIQLVGVLLGFVASLWVGTQIAPNLKIENAFLISFLLALLIFSNLWAYVNLRLQSLVNSTFPNLKLYRPKPDRMHWLMQAIIGGVVVAFTIYLLNLLFSYAGEILGSFIGAS